MSENRGFGRMLDRITGTGLVGTGKNALAEQYVGENIRLSNEHDDMHHDIAERTRQRGIAGIISYEGGNDTFIWKHPLENFYTGSQLIVHESQEAVFFLNGQALDLFPPGRHTLSTQNLPFLSRFFNMATRGHTPFTCSIYFINKTEQMAIPWGTPSKFEYIEPTYNIPLQLGASGDMFLRVEDSRKLLVKVVGTERGITNKDFVDKMRTLLVTNVKNYFTNYLGGSQINVFNIDRHLKEISAGLHNELIEDFLDYGVYMERFHVANVAKPEDDKHYQELKALFYSQHIQINQAKLRQDIARIDQETERERMVIDARGHAEKRIIEGYNYHDERRYGVADRIAANEATGPMTNVGIGLGMMSGIGGAIGNEVGSMVRDATSRDTRNPYPRTQDDVVCPSCDRHTPAGKFCTICGQEMVRRCHNCNAKLLSDGGFCHECGQKL